MQILSNINMEIVKNKFTALVGESGCGKTAVAKSILMLHNSRTYYYEGEILYNGKNLLDCNNNEMNKIRGKEISMIFQDSTTSLDPMFKIGMQLDEMLLVHNTIKNKDAKEKSIDMLSKVGLDREIYNMYSFELSGGMNQRVMIAMSMLNKPEFLIADEPTTALDVTSQKQVINLMKDFQRQFKMGILFISHDLDLVKEVADKVIVMYAGNIVEEGTIEEIFEEPKHPYTKALLKSRPNQYSPKDHINIIEGEVPSIESYTQGCRFYNRCKERKEVCMGTFPCSFSLSDTHNVYCHLYLGC